MPHPAPRPRAGPVAGHVLVRVDQVSIDEDRAVVVVGQVVIRQADGCTIEPGQARLLAAALVELADYAEGEVRPD